MNIQHSISTDLVLKAAPWVQASKDAEAATAGVVKQAEKLDQAIATKLSPHIRDLAASFKLSRDAMFGYEQQLDRTARANDRVAASAQRAGSAQSALAKSGAQFLQGSAQLGVNQFVGGAAAQVVNPVVGGLVGNAAQIGLAAVSGPALAIVGAFTAVGIAAKSLADSMDEEANRIREVVDQNLAAVRLATERRQTAESRVGDLSGRVLDRERLLPNQAENRALFESQLTERTQELVAARASLAEQERLLASSQARIASLQAGRAGAQSGLGDAAFNLARLASPGDESVTLARVQQLATQARTLQSGGDQDAAREKFAQAQQLLQQLFQSLGAPIDRLGEFQSAIALLGAEIDASFQASLDSASVTAATASASVSTLTSEVQSLDAAVAQAAANFNGIVRLMTENTSQLAALQAQLTAAKAELSAANVSEASANAAFAGAVEGMAGGGRSVTDNQLALLSVGEVVLNRNQQNAIGGAAALRRAGVPGFAGGGGFQDMLEGTRRFTAASEAAGSIDASVARSGWNDMANALMGQGLSYRQAWDTINRRRAAGLPPVFPGFTQTPTVASSLGNVQTFAEGGIVQPSSTVTMGDMHFDLRGAGANETTARDMAKTIRRQVRLGLSKLS